MKFQNILIPRLRDKIGETPLQTDHNVLKPLLEKHMAPKGKVALIVVNKGSLDFVWEDDLENVLTADSSHPIVIEPERYHHIIIRGRVEFRLEYYKDIDADNPDKGAARPGQDFIEIEEKVQE